MRFIKDPEARLDYTWDWTDWLTDGDTITSATITETAGGINTGHLTHNADTVTAWLTGGDPDTVARVTAQIQTAQGRTDERTLTLHIADR